MTIAADATKAKNDAAKTQEDAAATPPSAKAAALINLLKGGSFGEARSRAAAMAMEFPRATLPQKVMGAAAYHTGRTGDAIRHFHAALDMAPQDTETRINLTKALLRHGGDREGVEALLRAAEHGPEGMSAAELRQEALALSAACETAAARERLQDALDREPGDFETLETYARVVFAYPTRETTARGARAVMRMLVHPRIENRGAQHVAALTLLHELELGRRAAAEGETRKPAEWFTPLLIALLSHGMSTSIRLEPVLLGLREDLLRRVAEGSGAPLDQESLDLAEAFARHGFQCEYVWPETPEEAAMVETLRARVEQALKAGEPAHAASLFMLGAYRELARIPAIRDWVAAIAAQAPSALDPTLRRLVHEPLMEADLAPTLPSLTPIEDGVSAEVQAQYEENPYPRWAAISRQTPQPYIQAIAAQIYPNRANLVATSKEPKVLIAGCGTGQHPIGAAMRYENAQMLAIDLSRASLAYAARQAHQLGVANIAFAHADILRLTGVDETFDVVESVGVLHHMADPEAGLERVVAALKPGGFLSLGLYSRQARRHITKARERIAELGYAADQEGVRRFRQDIAAGALPELADLAVSKDFFSASNLRDLAFHVQEHQFDLPQIKALLEKHGLEFLGFSCLTPHNIRDYAEANPGDPSQTDLDAWAAYEETHPNVFAGMYQFWSRKL